MQKPVYVLVAALVALAACGKGGDQPPPQGAAPPPGDKAAYQVSLTGYVSKVYDCDHQLCVNASKAALQKLGLRVNEETGALFKKHFDVEGADGTSAAVDVVELGKANSRISIKVGYLLGDRDAAERIHSEIDAEVAGRRGQSIQTTGDWGASPPAAATPPTAAPRTPPQTFWAQPAPTAPPPTSPPPTTPPAPPPPPPPTAPPPTRPPATLPPATLPPPTPPPPAPTPNPAAPGPHGPAAGWE